MGGGGGVMDGVIRVDVDGMGGRRIDHMNSVRIDSAGINSVSMDSTRIGSEMVGNLGIDSASGNGTSIDSTSISDGVMMNVAIWEDICRMGGDYVWVVGWVVMRRVRCGMERIAWSIHSRWRGGIGRSVEWWIGSRTLVEADGGGDRGWTRTRG